MGWAQSVKCLSHKFGDLSSVLSTYIIKSERGDVIPMLGSEDRRISGVYQSANLTKSASHRSSERPSLKM